MTRAGLFAFLSSNKLAVVSSLSPAGEPQSAVVGIAVTPALELVFDTLNGSRKYRNLSANRRCSFVVWEGAVTIQYEGMARELNGEELARYRPVYLEAWPDGVERLGWPGITYFAVQPRWIRYSDFALTPPRIEELPVSEMQF